MRSNKRGPCVGAATGVPVCTRRYEEEVGGVRGARNHGSTCYANAAAQVVAAHAALFPETEYEVACAALNSQMRITRARQNAPGAGHLHSQQENMKCPPGEVSFGDQAEAGKVVDPRWASRVRRHERQVSDEIKAGLVRLWSADPARAADEKEKKIYQRIAKEGADKKAEGLQETPRNTSLAEF